MRARRASAALGAGLLLTAGLPPFGWWPLAIVGVALLARQIDDAPWRQRALLGFAAAVGFLAPGLWWMSEFTVPGWVLGTLLECALLTIGVAVARRATWLPLTLLLVDAVRSSWPFEGVPVATLAQTQVGGPLDDIARVGGELLITAVLVTLGVGIARRRLLVLPVVWLVVFANVYATDGFDQRDGRLDVAIVQGGGERGTRAIDTDEDVVFERHVEASELIRSSPDLVLWPENVVHVDEDVEGTDEGRFLASLARDVGAPVVAGVVESGDDEFLNFAYAWSADGEVEGVYEKNTRVPFGEWIPFRSIVEDLGDVSAVPRDMRVGTGPGFLSTDGMDLGVVISWEVFFADRARDAISSGGSVLLVPTNAASFSTSQMPALEVGAARLRAIETGRWLLQAAPTGFSAAITPNGGVHARTSLGERDVLHVTVEERGGETIYLRLGDGPFVVGALVLLVLRWAVARRRSSRTS